MGPEDRLPTDAKMKQIKKRRTTNIFKVALFMLRRGGKSSKSSMHTDVASKGLWRKLLGATRPLHLEDKKSSSPSAPHPATTKAATIVPEDEQPPQPGPLALNNIKPAFMTVEEEEEKTIVPLPRDNPQGSPSSASTSSGCEESCYASALNLRELDICDEEDDDDDEEEEDCQFDDSAGDSMIDVKAEMFIAQFYEQMRLQNSQTATYQMIRG